ncbi:MAG: glycosyl hydrolase [Pseudomonadota bacterium]
MKKLILGALMCAPALHATAAPAFIYSPYQHLAHHTPYLVDGKRTVGPGALTWAFATGECGEERWVDDGGQQVADANVAAFDQAGVDYIVSTGGQGGVFTCATDEGMERFIRRYASARLIGIDFDIEAGQTARQVDSLIQRIKAAQEKRPQLRYSFTLATHAASDGSGKSLNREGEAILAALRRHGVRAFTFNLMVMDYGPGDSSVCVLKRGKLCDMGRSALQAARNVNRKYGIPFAQIELTAMIGVNDVVSNVFTLDDARLLAAAVKKMKLAGLHYWSLDRDRPCSAPLAGASAHCSGMPLKALEYNRVLAESLR